MPRFAIVAHDYPSPHWDLFLEAGAVLRSWRLPSPLQPGLLVHAEPAPDHRLHYLDYEGPVGGGRGSVVRVDAGTFAVEVDSTDELGVRLTGYRFVGRLTLRRGPDASTCRFDPE